MKVELEIIESNCRSGYHKKGDTFIVEDLCPPLCQELWHAIYPNVFTLVNNGTLNYGEKKAQKFRIKCPDNGLVTIEGRVTK